MPALFVFILLAFLAEVLGVLGGFGSSMFFVPMAQFFVGVQTVLALTAILHVFSNSTKVVLFWKHIHWRTALPFIVPSLLFVAVGAVCVPYLGSRWLEVALGGVLILLALGLLLKPKFKLRQTAVQAGVTGGISGFLTGLVGTGGAIRAVGLAAFELSKEAFVATSGAIDFFTDATRAVIYLLQGYLQTHELVYIPLLFGVALAGNWVGKQLLGKISSERFRKVMLSMVLAVGVITLLRGLQWLPQGVV